MPVPRGPASLSPPKNPSKLLKARGFRECTKKVQNAGATAISGVRGAPPKAFPQVFDRRRGRGWEAYLENPVARGLARILHQVSSRGVGSAALTRRYARGPRRRCRALRRGGRGRATQSARMTTAPQQNAGEPSGLGIRQLLKPVRCWVAGLFAELAAITPGARLGLLAWALPAPPSGSGPGPDARSPVGGWRLSASRAAPQHCRPSGRRSW